MKASIENKTAYIDELKKAASELTDSVRNQVPLVHQITNYVTVNDCANATLAIGGSPVMADDMEEAEDITAISSALVINIGTLNKRTIGSMIASGKQANKLGIPVILDPVGAGASKLRNDTAMMILDQIKIAVLRGNLSEISFIAGLSSSTRGVDASEADAGQDGAAIARETAVRYGCVTAITGAVDIISDGTRCITIHNGHPMMSKVTGTGCMTTAVTAAFTAAADDAFTGAAAGILAMGIAGEIAFEKHGTSGTASFRTGLIDALSLMDQETIEKRGLINEG